MTGRCSWRRLCLSCSKIPGSHTKVRCPPHTTLWVQTVGPSHEGAVAAFPSSQVEDASQGSLVQAGCSEESNLCEQFARPSCPWVWPLFLLHTRPDPFAHRASHRVPAAIHRRHFSPPGGPDSFSPAHRLSLLLLPTMLSR